MEKNPPSTLILFIKTFFFRGFSLIFLAKNHTPQKHGGGWETGTKTCYDDRVMSVKFGNCWTARNDLS